MKLVLQEESFRVITKQMFIYKNKSKIEALVIASLVTPDKSHRKQILEKKVVLKKESTEKTVLRFKLDNNFKVVPGSVNSLRKSLAGRY